MATTISAEEFTKKYPGFSGIPTGQFGATGATQGTSFFQRFLQNLRQAPTKIFKEFPEAIAESAGVPSVGKAISTIETPGRMIGEAFTGGPLVTAISPDISKEEKRKVYERMNVALEAPTAVRLPSPVTLEAIRGKLTPKVQQQLAKEGRIIKGKTGLFKKEPDIIKESQREVEIANTVQQRIKNFDQLNEFQKPARLGEESIKIRNELKPEMQKVKVSFDVQENITNKWESLKQTQSENPYYKNTRAFKGTEKKFDDVVNEVKYATNMDDLWEIRIKYDKSVPESIRNAKPGLASDEALLQREIWLQRRNLLNEALTDASTQLGTKAAKAFKDMNNLLEAQKKTASLVKIDVKGKPSPLKSILKKAGITIAGSVLAGAGFEKGRKALNLFD